MIQPLDKPVTTAAGMAGQHYEEWPLSIDSRGHVASGIITMPNVQCQFTIIMLPPTRACRLGPNRLFVTLARGLALSGITAIRLDLEIEALSRIDHAMQNEGSLGLLNEYYSSLVEILNGYSEIKQEKIFLGFSLSAMSLINCSWRVGRLILISANTASMPVKIHCDELLLIYAAGETDLEKKLLMWKDILAHNPFVRCTQVIVDRAEHHFFSWDVKEKLVGIISEWICSRA